MVILCRGEKHCILNIVTIINAFFIMKNVTVTFNSKTLYMNKKEIIKKSPIFCNGLQERVIFYGVLFR
jgi:hypothetical protein